MQYSTFAAIDIGSYDVILEIFEIDLETFFDDNACSYELCTGILYQGCQSFQRFSVCQEIIDQLSIQPRGLALILPSNASSAKTAVKASPTIKKCLRHSQLP